MISGSVRFGGLVFTGLPICICFVICELFLCHFTCSFLSHFLTKALQKVYIANQKYRLLGVEMENIGRRCLVKLLGLLEYFG